jgi:signal transduction histidine kinase
MSSETTIRILLVEDNPGDVRLLQESLGEGDGAGFELEVVDRLSTGLERLAKGGIDLVLLDLGLPDCQGLDTLTRVHAAAPEVPNVILTALDDEAVAVQAVQRGAQDYLVKGQIESRLLTRAIRYAIERKRAEETLQALYRASLHIQEPLGLRERIDRLLQTARDILHLDRLVVLLSDPEGRWLKAVASLGTEEPLESIRVPIGPEGGGLAKAYLTKGAIFWDGSGPVPADLRLRPPYDQIASLRSKAFANIPLVVQGRAIGVLGVDSKRSRRPLHPEMHHLLQLFAAQAALAIEHGRLYEERRMAAIQLEATVEARTRELQAANIQLQEAMRQAQAASRHKSAFLANMSHELRTPLNAILGFSELLAQQTYGPLTQKQARYVDNIHTSGQHLLALINDLLDLSKVEAGKLELHPQSFHLREALEAALHTIRLQAEAKGQLLHLQVADDLSTITADPLRVRQALYNLLSNAVKFTPAGGSITVTAKMVSSSEFGVSSSQPETRNPKPETASASEFVEIAVADSGIGIKAEDLQKLFQLFTQLEHTFTKQAQGTGLGLALTRRLVELHGGTIWAESAGEGRGSTFTIWLPLRSPAS